jgi:ribonuclease BN (tRNA processing enzyme)
VKILLVPSSVLESDEDAHQYLTSCLINDTIAIDAGSLGFFKSPDDQARIKHILISHTHIDHIASLPIFVENAYEAKRDCVTIHGSETVLDCLQRDLFNDRVWPDFIRMSLNESREAPFLKLETLEAGKPIDLDGVRITPVPVDHLVPTMGFIIEEGDVSVVVSSDTGPTEELWQRANRVPNLKAVFLEVCFPNNMEWLAKSSKHLTPLSFAGEVGKLHRPAKVIAVHIKARFHDQVVKELEALCLSNLEIGHFGVPYHF